ncbi:MAG: hypothetical protein ACJ797_20660 [Ktedonobacteraceae bacterium]
MASGENQLYPLYDCLSPGLASEEPPPCAHGRGTKRNHAAMSRVL